MHGATGLLRMRIGELVAVYKLTLYQSIDCVMPDLCVHACPYACTYGLLCTSYFYKYTKGSLKINRTYTSFNFLSQSILTVIQSAGFIFNRSLTPRSVSVVGRRVAIGIPLKIC